MKYCPEIIEEIASYLKDGNNRTDSCVLAGIHYDTFMEWIRNKPAFSEAVKKAEAENKARNISIVQKAGSTHWQAAAWWLERRYPNEFALKTLDFKKEEDIPKRMAERAAELLKKFEGKPIDVNAFKKNGTNGNGFHP